MATIAELREKYALHMTVERFVSIRELVQDFSEAYGWNFRKAAENGSRET